MKFSDIGMYETNGVKIAKYKKMNNEIMEDVPLDTIHIPGQQKILATLFGRNDIVRAALDLLQLLCPPALLLLLDLLSIHFFDIHQQNILHHILKTFTTVTILCC